MKWLALSISLLMLLLGPISYAQIVKYTCEVEADKTTHKRFPGTAGDIPTAYLMANANCSFYNMTQDCKRISCQKLVFYPPVKAAKGDKPAKDKKDKSNKKKKN